ncbi:B12-binding domain-containing protein [Eubacterium limosum]|uniref:B12-binding domain-containing protein n=1 Tax=Eubacterium limosum TaxID=1736 RepID=UPI0022E78982|nr:B12-binding domain-containing protein [Eubacterium limosum]
MEFKVITNLMANLEEEKLMVFVDEFLALDPSREEGLNVIEACRRGTEKVGTLFETGEYFAGDLLQAGQLFKEVKKRLEPVVGSKMDDLKSGAIALGPVYGDGQGGRECDFPAPGGNGRVHCHQPLLQRLPSAFNELKSGGYRNGKEI